MAVFNARAADGSQSRGAGRAQQHQTLPDPGSIRRLLSRGEAEKLEAGPRLKPGTVLMREHRGVRHTVTVVLNGFVWQEQTFPSLTTVARAITGTSWNGPRFFGLRIKRD